jgi:hypothetical protein
MKKFNEIREENERLLNKNTDTETKEAEKK